MTILVVDEIGSPVNGAIVSHQKLPPSLQYVPCTGGNGTTDAGGRLALTFEGTEGDVCELEVHCPTGYEPKGRRLLVPLRVLFDSGVPEYRSTCRTKK